MQADEFQDFRGDGDDQEVGELSRELDHAPADFQQQADFFEEKYHAGEDAGGLREREERGKMSTVCGWIYQLYSLPEVLARGDTVIDFQIENRAVSDVQSVPVCSWWRAVPPPFIMIQICSLITRANGHGVGLSHSVCRRISRMHIFALTANETSPSVIFNLGKRVLAGWPEPNDRPRLQ